MKRIYNKSKKHNFFIINGFIWKSLVKDKIVYISSCLYFIFVLLFTSIIPIKMNMGILFLLENPIGSIMLILCGSVVAALYVISIFRNWHDDGTELMVLSKPISRNEILLNKIFVLFCLIILNAVISTILSLFSLIYPSASYDERITVFIGIFVGTIITFLFFSSITAILSLYGKKIFSLVITILVSFVTIFVSFMQIYFGESPVRTIQKNYPLNTKSIVLQKNKNVEIVDGAWTQKKQGVTDLPTFDVAWNMAKSNSVDFKTSYINFGFQLSSFYTFNHFPKDTTATFLSLLKFNYPYDFKINKFDLLNNSFINSSKFNNPNIPTIEFDSKYYLDKIILILDANSKLRTNGNTVASYHKYTGNIVSQFTNSSDMWNKAWEKNKYSIKPESTNQEVTTSSEFLENYTRNITIGINYPDNVLNDLNKLAYSASIRFREINANNAILEPNNLSNEQKVILQLLSCNITEQKYIENGTTKTTYTISNKKTTFKNKNFFYDFYPVVNFINFDKDLQNSFFSIKVVPLINQWYLFAGWIILSLLLHSLAYLIYRRKDFR